MSRVVIHLDESDLWRIKQLANGRSVFSRARGIQTQKVDPSRSDVEIDLDGMRGEYAVAKFFGETPSMECRPDDGWDLYLSGYRCQVKTTRHPRGRLIIRRLDNINADIFVLAIIEADNAVRLAGWIKAEDAADACVPFEVHGHSGYAVTQDRLRPVGELLEMIQLEKTCSEAA